MGVIFRQGDLICSRFLDQYSLSALWDRFVDPRIKCTEKYPFAAASKKSDWEQTMLRCTRKSCPPQEITRSEYLPPMKRFFITSRKLCGSMAVVWLWWNVLVTSRERQGCGLTRTWKVASKQQDTTLHGGAASAYHSPRDAFTNGKNHGKGFQLHVYSSGSITVYT